MREFSIRSSILNKYRNKLLLKDSLFAIILLGLPIFLIILYSYGLNLKIMEKKAFTFIEFLYYNNVIIIIIYILLVLLFLANIVILLFILRKDNRLFHSKYLNYIFDECKLNDIHFQFRKKVVDKTLFEELENIISISNIERIFSISGVTPVRLIEFNQIKYGKNKNNKNGVLITVNAENNLNGFFQIRTKGEPSISDYENKSILHFGFQKALSNYKVYYSLGSYTYSINNDEFIKLIDDYKKFVRCNFVITRKDGTISILLDSFQFTLTSSFLKPYKADEFDKKVESMIRLHSITNEIINYLLRLKI